MTRKVSNVVLIWSSQIWVAALIFNKNTCISVSNMWPGPHGKQWSPRVWRHLENLSYFLANSEIMRTFKGCLSQTFLCSHLVHNKRVEAVWNIARSYTHITWLIRSVVQGQRWTIPPTRSMMCWPITGAHSVRDLRCLNAPQNDTGDHSCL